MAYIGIDLGGTFLKAGRVQKGRIVEFLKIKTGKTKKEILQQIFTAIVYLKKGKINGIGIGVPAPVVDDQVKTFTNIPQLNYTNIKKIVEKGFSIPVKIANDANCFTLAEAQKYKKNCVVGITLGTGLGTGIVINGKLYTGSAGCAGELGPVKFNGSKKIETFAASKFFGKHYQTIDHAKAGKAADIKKLSKFGIHVGRALSVIAGLLDPDVIVLGGKIANGFPFFKQSMKETLKSNLFPPSYKKLSVKKSTMKNAGIIGSTLLFEQ